MNKAIEIGRLTRDPEVRYSQGEQYSSSKIHYCGRQKIQKRGRTNSRFHPLRSVWKTGGVCREVFQKRNKSCYFWKNHNRKLYKQGWSENIYH